MGDIAEMILEGTLCQECGIYMDDEDDFAHSCQHCEPSHQVKLKKGKKNEIVAAKTGTAST